MPRIVIPCSQELKDEFKKYCQNKWQSEASEGRRIIEEKIKESND